jgi:PrsW family intramembrane metalloprotease
MSHSVSLETPVPPAEGPRTDWLSVAQFALSALAVLFLWGSAATLGALAVTDRLGLVPSLKSNMSATLLSAVALVTGCLLLPSVYFAFRRIIGRPALQMGGQWLRWLRPTVWIFLLPVVLLLGYWVSTHPNLSWFLLPPLHVLAIGLPVYWLVYLAVRRLPLGHPQRLWGVMGSGLLMGPAFILVLEIGALLAYALIAVVALMSQPQAIDQLNALVQHLQMTPDAAPDLLMNFFQPYLTHPGVIFGVFSFAAVIVPLIEELFKPIGVWLLAGRGLTPAAGFAAGAISGAGYALFESMSLAADGTSWIFIVVARFGTDIIHILTAGLTGWALALAWRERRYLRLAVTYLCAVAIHGLWNGLTVFSTFAALASLQGNNANLKLIEQVGEVAPYGLIFLAVGGFAILLLANRSLREHLPHPVSPVQPEPPQ